jgi:hypothetical protein
MTQPAKSAAFLCTLLALSACADEPQASVVKTSPPPTIIEPTVKAREAPPALTSAAPKSLRSILAPTPVPSISEKSPSEPEKVAEPTIEQPLADEVRVERFSLTSGIVAREPIDEGNTFAPDNDGIFAFFQLANETASPTEVFVHFEKMSDPDLPYGIALQVPVAKRWRTWAVTRIHREPGSYRAVLRNADGKDLATRTFEVIAPE